MSTSTPIPAFIGKNPETIDRFLESKGFKRYYTGFRGARFPEEHHAYGVNETSSLHVFNDGRVVTTAYIFDSPDSGFIKALQSPLVTKLLTSAVTTVFTGGLVDAPVTPDVVLNVSEGTPAMFDDFGDFGVSDAVDSFDPFGFSSGESDLFFSDSEVVNFGFDTDPSAIIDSVSVDGVIPDDVAAYSDGVDIGNTPEVGTNDFGTQFEPSFGDESIQTAVKGVKLAQTVSAKPSGSGATAKTASGGSSGAKQRASGSNDILSSFGQAFQDLGSVAASISGTAAQKTTSVARTFTGQLDPTKTGTSKGMDTHTLLLITAGLIAAAFVFKKGGN